MTQTLRQTCRHFTMSCFPACDRQRRTVNFQNRSEAPAAGGQRGSGALTHDGSSLSAPHPRKPRHANLGATFGSAAEAQNSFKPRVRYKHLFIVPLNLSTAYGIYLRTWIFPEFRIFRPWLLVSSTGSMANGYQKTKYYHFSSWPFITERF